jgi:hypothetical protein
MSGRALNITSRVIFFLCGATSFLTCLPYAMLRGIGLPWQSEWIVFLFWLALLGFVGVVTAVLPGSWLAKLWRRDREEPGLFSQPLKLLAIFAAVFYLLALVAYFAPHSWNLDAQLMFALCPLYLVKMTFDPSLVAVLFLLAPMNAAVYGCLGLTLSYAWRACGRRG